MKFAHLPGVLAGAGHSASAFVALPALLVLSTVASAAQAQAPSARAVAEIKRIEASPAFRKAVSALEAAHDQWVETIVTLTEIPSPPFKEATRARAYLEMLKSRGLTDVEIDPEGNVLGMRKGAGGGGLVVVSAHMDTVFPEGTPVKVRREGEKLFAPGVGDDTTGLATLLKMIDAMNAGGIQTRDDILFVGTVGEEGAGDLRGVRYLFTQGKYKDRASAFFSIDGSGLDTITTGGAGSRRYRVTFKGPGGHSYGAFGIVNPMAAMAQAVVDFYKIPVPQGIKTTYSASVVGGGTSVNAIPREVWMEFDMRSESADELAKVDTRFLEILKEAAASENAARSTKEGSVTVDPRLIGDRPAGQTDKAADIVQFATAAYAAEGIKLGYSSSSTDSNIPISLGIPAITIARVANGGRGHSLDEWVGTEKAPNIRLQKIDLATIVATAGMK
jgi:tripeptide aminopeptidase